MRPETKICETCKQRLPRKKESIRSYENGFKVSDGGREKWMTKEAEQQRKDEVFERDKQVDDDGETFWKCAKCGKVSWFRTSFEVDHIIKRSINRDDRLINLQLLGKFFLCGCHDKKHDEFKKKAAK